MQNPATSYGNTRLPRQDLRQLQLSMAGYLYTLTEKGILMCLRAKGGKLRWQRDLPSMYDVEVLPYGFSGSPVADENLIIMNANTSGIALDKKTGKLIWASEPHKKPIRSEHYAIAVCFDYNGVRSSLLFSRHGLYCVETETGKQQWFHKFFPSFYNAADAVLVGNQVFIAASGTVDDPSALLDISTNPPTILWINDHLNTVFPTAVHVDGYLGSKGAYHTQLRSKISLPFSCVELSTDGTDNVGKEFVVCVYYCSRRQVHYP